MKTFTTITSICIPIMRKNIDTDQIIPARYLKAIDKDSVTDGLFADWRYNPDGTINKDFILNQPEYKNAQILLAGDNFGCGSSREHAPWALEDFGIRVIIAPSFADIFYNNCFKNGLLPIILAEETVEQLFKAVEANEGFQLTVDLEQQKIFSSSDSSIDVPFELDKFRRHCLLEGLDEIGLTLEQTDDIRAYERKQKEITPWLF